MTTASEIKKMALDCGACELIKGAESIADLVALMKTPQGREFCKEHKFPTLEILRQHKKDIAYFNVYVDAGTIDVLNIDNVIVAGDTFAKLWYDKTDRPYHVMVMGGAKAIVNAHDYAVCNICLVGGEVEAHEWSNASVYIR